MAGADNRCRLVLVVPDIAETSIAVKAVADALRGGDVASVIMPQYGMTDRDFQDYAEKLVPLIQEAGVAALIAGDSRVAGRARADGLHIEADSQALADAIEKHSPKMIVGSGNIPDRHHALEIGECNPDYVFFGKLDGDIRPEAHPKNVALGEWWASMVEIPCIVMGGTSIESIVSVAETGAEFVALRTAIFGDLAAAARAVAEANALLDEKAPRFGD
ncbi:thiamine phosphate synthase [Rhizobium sp. PAMB 3174]